MSEEKSNNIIKKSRNSNIELLRILSMLAIIFCHITGESDVLNNLGENGQLFFGYLKGIGNISVNIFLIIGTWFMVDSDFKGKRVLKLYSELFLYTVTITTIMVIIRSRNNN